MSSSHKWWKNSPRAPALDHLDDNTPSFRFLTLIESLSRRQASLMTQLHTRHIWLNKDLKGIGKSLTDRCPAYQNTAETAFHFLLMCPAYAPHHHVRDLAPGRASRFLKFLLSSPKASTPSFAYIDSTGRFKSGVKAFLRSIFYNLLYHPP